MSERKSDSMHDGKMTNGASKWTDERTITGFHRLDNELATETVNHPDHYQGNKYEVIDIIEDYNLGFSLGNVIKYVLRADKKNNRVEDLRKAQWYLNRELERGKCYNESTT